MGMSKRPLIIEDSSTFSPVFSLSLCLSVVSAQTRITQTTPLKCTMAFLWISRALSRLSAADNSLYCALELTISANRLLPCQSHFKFPISHTHTHTHKPPTSILWSISWSELIWWTVNIDTHIQTHTHTQSPGIILHTNRSIHPGESMLLGNKPLRANRYQALNKPRAVVHLTSPWLIHQHQRGTIHS